MSLFSPTSLQVYPLTYQSQGITVSEWISLFTLCLAPLVAHIIIGTPEPTYLCNSRPSWSERICHYNPTSIVWRYAAITDRRVRALSWSSRDMAASNALFWTSRGWDGSERMVDLSIPHCLHLPPRPRVGFLSKDMLKIVVVTLQGVQALILLGSVFQTDPNSVEPFTVWMAVDIIFFPVAVLGLLRLCAGLWLSEDFLFAPSHSIELDEDCGEASGEARRSVDSLLEAPVAPLNRFRSTSFWGSRLFRLLFGLPLVVMLTMGLLYLMIGATITTTSALAIVFYLVLFGFTTAIYSYYSFRGHITSTIIPCISSTWYKVYTGFVICSAAMLFIIACIETRKTPCGKYTSGPSYLGDRITCWTPKTHVMPVDPNPAAGFPYFALASTEWLGYPNDTLPVLKQGEFWLYNYTGNCLGLGDFVAAQLSEVMRVVNDTNNPSYKIS